MSAPPPIGPPRVPRHVVGGAELVGCGTFVLRSLCGLAEPGEEDVPAKIARLMPEQWRREQLCESCRRRLS